MPTSPLRSCNQQSNYQSVEIPKPMKANYSTQPHPNRFGNPIPTRQFSFSLRIGNWRLTERGLFRWWGFKAIKANANGHYAMRYGWKRVGIALLEAVTGMGEGIAMRAGG